MKRIIPMMPGMVCVMVLVVTAMVFTEITGTEIPNFDVVPEVNITLEKADYRQRFRFYCDFAQSNENLFYRAVWRIEGSLSYTSPVVSGSDSHLRHNLSLSEDQIQRSAGFYIYCKIEASYTQEGRLSSSDSASKPRFIGINVLTPIVRIKEGGTGQIQIQAAAEIGCIGPRHCDYGVTIQIPQTLEPCVPGLNVESSCGVNIFDNGANGVHNISLIADISNQYGVSRSVFEVTLQSERLYFPHTIWQNYTIYPRVTVIIEKDTTSTQSKICTAYGRSWLTPFGDINHLTRLSMQASGTYTLYHDKGNDIEVQIHTVNCTRTGYCNCGMVARSGTTFYMISKCNSQYWLIDYVRCGDGIEALKVSKADMYTYKVAFPTGVMVDVRLQDGAITNTGDNSAYIDITVYPSVIDVRRPRGLCGQLLENGTVLLTPGKDNTGFIESWKVEDNRNMFNVSVMAEWPESDTTTYTCRCVRQGSFMELQTNISCDTQRPVRVCQESSRYKAVSKRSCMNTFSRKRRSIPFYHIAKPSYSRHKRQASWKGSWTEDTAKQFCTDLFNKSAVVELCRNKVPGVDVESSFQTCVDDIKLSGTTDFALTSTTSVHTQCVHEVYVNPVLQTQQEDKPSVLEEVEAMDCPEQCSERGQCLNGSCKCDNGYIGDACDIPFNLPPSALEIEYGGHCDVRTENCDDVSIFGGTFTDNPTARCRIIKLKMSVNGTVDESEPQTTIPTVESISETVCPLPARSVTPSSIPHQQQTYTEYKISVSNNGEHYSEELSMVMYNSECITCWKRDNDMRCLISGRHCVTDDVCYHDSERYISNQDYVCRVDASGPRWELSTQDTEEDNQIFIVIGAVCSVAVLIVAAIIIAVVCKKGWDKTIPYMYTHKTSLC